MSIPALKEDSITSSVLAIFEGADTVPRLKTPARLVRVTRLDLPPRDVKRRRIPFPSLHVSRTAKGQVDSDLDFPGPIECRWPHQDGHRGRSLKDEEPLHVTTHRKPRSLLRRLVYFMLMLATGGGAGAGGWVLKDHPRVQAVLEPGAGQAGGGRSRERWRRR